MSMLIVFLVGFGLGVCLERLWSWFAGLRIGL